MKYIIKNQDSHIFQNLFYDYKTEALLSPIETQNYVIIQVAWSNYNRGFVINNHKQLCDFELTFSHINGLVCSTDEVYEKVDKHGVYLSFKGEMHALKSRKNACFQTLAVNFKDTNSELLAAVKEKFQNQKAFCCPEIFSYITELITEFKLSNALFFEEKLDALITSILIRLVRFGEQEALDKILSYDDNLSAMKNHIDTHFLQIYSLEELSSAFGYTYSYICKAFKKAYGITPNDYLLSKKNEYACTLLKEGKKLEEIAEILGYSSAFNFSRAFKTKNGICPSAYKKQIKNSNE